MSDEARTIWEVTTPNGYVRCTALPMARSYTVTVEDSGDLLWREDVIATELGVDAWAQHVRVAFAAYIDRRTRR